MTNIYFLFASEDYDAGGGLRDYIGAYDSVAAAQAALATLAAHPKRPFTPEWAQIGRFDLGELDLVCVWTANDGWDATWWTKEVKDDFRRTTTWAKSIGL